MRKWYLTLLVAGLLVVLAVPVTAQGGLDYSLPPTYGSVDLVSGYTPDPYGVAIVAGGAVDVHAALGDQCEGFAIGHAASAPDFRLNYTAGDYGLRMLFAGEGDTVLIVNAPDGMWYCNDDGGGLEQPMLTWLEPMSGQYDVWVATYLPGEVVTGNLYITENPLIPAVDYLADVAVSGAVSADGKSEPVTGLAMGIVPSAGIWDVVSGFEDDPMLIEVTSGGVVDGQSRVEICGGPIGYYPSKPSVAFNYTAGSYPLTVLFYNTDEADTTMIIQAPDGSFYCDDDSAGLLQPGYTWDAPMSGTYTVWVGSYDSAQFSPGGVFISEVVGVDALTIASLFNDSSGDAGDPGAVSSGTMDYSLEPTFGAVDLAAGFVPDPHAVPMVAGGPVNVYAAIGTVCDGANGFAAEAPDYRLFYSGSSSMLRIFFVSDNGEDTTLAVNAPDGSWYCNDDAAGTLDGMVELIPPMAGQYDIWIGTYAEGDFIGGTLNITETQLDPSMVGSNKQ